MVRAIGLRVARTLLAIWLIVTLAFLIISYLPGDPARLILGQRASVETLEKFRQTAHLNESKLSRYALFLEQAAALDFGDSLAQRRPVRTVIAERAPQTIKLALAAFGLVLAFAFALPVLEASLRPVLERQWTVVFWGSVAAFPPYVLAVALLMLFGSTLQWVPLLFDPNNPGSWLLPAFVLASYPIAIASKLFHQQIALGQRQLYTLRARASGFSPRQVMFFEVLPNAVTPSLAALANSIAFFVTGTFFVEVVFGLPGLGGLTYEAIRSKDLPLLLGLCIIFAITTTVISALLEIAILFANPRLRRQRA